MKFLTRDECIMYGKMAWEKALKRLEKCIMAKISMVGNSTTRWVCVVSCLYVMAYDLLELADHG